VFDDAGVSGRAHPCGPLAGCAGSRPAAVSGRQPPVV